ncbi:hypothetical protein EW026_g5586 [Hermanssonia centrifuga]|uniref:3-beta hydroxysteroid dehydrogenase/isomerase domain-containing protein n=1 Tax=Hermanssonia centrifuga TaxID=98765 RepID=A0A4S4KI26_9APHY|nr:hypothetical protein EW026_g5586 [Hermanssonia centrifuga]
MSQINYVLVTGATGFIGAHIVDELLCRGLKVRAAARSQSKANQMIADRPQHKGRLDFVFIDDLTRPGVFDSAVKNVDAVIHTASPVTFDATDNEKELMLPAIQGTKSMLDAIKKEPSVKRLVCTSSFAAVFDASRGDAPGLTYTSADWNPLTYDEGKQGEAIIGYRVGKKYAELAAWDCIRNDHPHFDLVTFCPPMVFGPVVHPVPKVADLNETNAILWSVAAGKRPLPVSRVPCWIDVRELALAHVEGLLRPEAGNRRYTIAAPDHFSYGRAAHIIRQEFGWAKEVVAEGDGGALPDAFYVDGETASKEFGIKYRSFEETVVDAISQFKDIQSREQQNL